MRIHLVGLCLFLGSALSQSSYLVYIRSAYNDRILRVFDGDIRTDGIDGKDSSTLFRIVVRKRGLLSRLGRRGDNRNILSISPESDENLYVAYSNSNGLVLKVGKTYWRYKRIGENGYMLRVNLLRMNNRCLTWMDGDRFDMLRCNEEDRRQIFFFEEQVTQDEPTVDLPIVRDEVAVEENAAMETNVTDDNSTSSGCDTESSESTHHVHDVKPILINLNLRGANLLPTEANASKSGGLASVSTTTVYIPSDRSMNSRIEVSSRSSSVRAPRRISIPNDSSSSQDNDIPRSDTILSSILRNDFNMDSGHDSYPELDKLFEKLHHDESGFNGRSKPHKLTGIDTAVEQKPAKTVYLCQSHNMMNPNVSPTTVYQYGTVSAPVTPHSC